ncbi:Transmembrane 9 super member 2 [Savitreella phatthalungensis]
MKLALLPAVAFALSLPWFAKYDTPFVYWPDRVLPFYAKSTLVRGQVTRKTYYDLSFVTRPQQPFSDKNERRQGGITWDDFVLRTPPHESPFGVWMEANDPCRVTSVQRLDARAVREAISTIDQGEMLYWTIDGLPASKTHRTANKKENYYTRGVGFGERVGGGRATLYNHFTVVIKYRYSDNKDDTKVILAFEVYPRSIANQTLDYTDDVDETAGPRKCHPELTDLPASANPFYLEDEDKRPLSDLQVRFTHSVFFREELAFHHDKRWERFYKFDTLAIEKGRLVRTGIFWGLAALALLVTATLLDSASIDHSLEQDLSHEVQENAVGSRRGSELAQAVASVFRPHSPFLLLPAKVFYLIVDFVDDGLPAVAQLGLEEERYLVPLMSAGLTLPVELTVVHFLGTPGRDALVALATAVVAAGFCSFVSASSIGRSSIVRLNRIQAFQLAVRTSMVLPFLVGLPLLVADAVRDSQSAPPIFISRNDGALLVLGYACMTGVGHLAGCVFAYGRVQQGPTPSVDLKAAYAKLNSLRSSGTASPAKVQASSVSKQTKKRTPVLALLMKPLFRTSFVYGALLLIGTMYWRQYLSAYTTGVVLNMEGAVDFAIECAAVALAESLFLSMALASAMRFIRRGDEDSRRATTTFAVAVTPSFGIFAAVVLWCLGTKWDRTNLIFVGLVSTIAAVLHALISGSLVTAALGFVHPEHDNDVAVSALTRAD